MLNQYVGFSTTNNQKDDKDKIKEIEDLILRALKRCEKMIFHKLQFKDILTFKRKQTIEFEIGSSNEDNLR